MGSDLDTPAYDEFGLFPENAFEVGLAYDGPPAVRREFVAVDPDGRRVSALVWGTERPELVLVHGGGQNAHTWDTVALALDRPLVAVDLPGHGHSDRAPNGPLDPRAHARDVAAVVARLAPEAAAVVGMSLGGLTTIALSAVAPELVRRVVLVDVTPAVEPTRAAPIHQFLSGPESFASFDEVLDRTVEFNPTRSPASLRRGVLHNAMQREDGRWVWRHQRWGLPEDFERRTSDFPRLWEEVARISVPMMLVRGDGPGSVVTDEHVETLLACQPDARVEMVHGAGHSIQGDQPLALARLLEDFVPRGRS